LAFLGSNEYVLSVQLAAADDHSVVKSRRHDAEFDAILQRVKDAGLTFGSGPRSLEDGKLNDWNGGRGFYYKDHDGHVIELMTMPQ
jgi:catechol 2,3-dioxygenase-like lactoylglutathione lyase family enzyme